MSRATAAAARTRALDALARAERLRIRSPDRALMHGRLARALEHLVHAQGSLRDSAPRDTDQVAPRLIAMIRSAEITLSQIERALTT